MQQRSANRHFTNTDLPPKFHEVDKKACLKGPKISGSLTKNTKDKAKDKQLAEL